jgi:hypothetical protein
MEMALDLLLVMVVVVLLLLLLMWLQCEYEAIHKYLIICKIMNQSSPTPF